MKKRMIAKIMCGTMLIGALAVPVQAAETKIAWYAPAPHTYFEEVQKGVELFVEEQGTEVLVQIGPDWTQASQNEKVEALVAQGYNALAIYPSDASGANGLYEEIHEKMGVNIVNFGTDVEKPTVASLAVGQDVKQMAMDQTEALIEMMGGKGKILNVMEVLEDTNTAIRKAAVEEVVAKYPDVEIIQEIAGIKNEEEAVSKIESAVSANIGEIDGIVCTGMISSIGLVQVLTDYYEKQPDAEHIYTISVDTDPRVMEGVEKGTIDATIASNYEGHGYLSCMALKLLGEGYTVKDGEYFIDTGLCVVTKDNMNSFADDLHEVTLELLDKLTTDYLTK